jgi:NADH:ubiquinone oxidoreductase subunit 5 (subunit L)/multisubunit Na+/H+ antiporter MnhA subunit
MMANDLANRLFGGPPLSVLVRLILLCVLVCVILSVLGLDPRNIFYSFERIIRGLWDMGWDAVRWLWRYFLLGAILVVPIWLIVRLFKTPAGR